MITLTSILTRDFSSFVHISKCFLGINFASSQVVGKEIFVRSKCCKVVFFIGRCLIGGAPKEHCFGGALWGSQWNIKKGS